MKNEIISILINFVEQRISSKEFGDIFYKNNYEFEEVLKSEGENEFNQNFFYDLLDTDFNSQDYRAQHLVKEYLKRNKIEIPLTTEKLELVEKSWDIHFLSHI